MKRQLRVTRATTYGLTVHGRFFTLVAAGVNETKKRSPLGERANRPWTLLHASRGWRERNEAKLVKVGFAKARAADTEPARARAR